MSYTLCLDFGNSKKKVAIFNKSGNIENIFYVNQSQDIKEILTKYDISHSAYCSVIAKDMDVEYLLSKTDKYTYIDYHYPFSFSSETTSTKTIGADRCVLLEQATQKFSNKNNLIISIGTCITYNFLNVYNQFLGGAISPGLHMKFEALHTKTYALPKVNYDTCFSLIGNNTKTNILSGVIFGTIKEIKGIIEEYKLSYRDLNVIITGGDSDKLKQYFNEDYLFDKHFLLRGLFSIANACE